MQQKAAMVGLHSGQGLKVLLGLGKRTGPRADFHNDSPDQSEDV